MRAHAHRTQANLHVRENLALQPIHADYRQRYSCEYQQNVDQRPERAAVLAGCGLPGFLQVVGDEAGHQRSTSPRTMSSVPITAITSAINCPRHIESSA